MTFPKVQAVSTADGHMLVVDFTDGTRKYYDVLTLMEREMFAPLKNEAFFKNVSIEQGGHGVSWNSQIDISEYELWRNGTAEGTAEP
jgi:hypothetical protein